MVLINGKEYSWSSISVRVEDDEFLGITSVNYSVEVERGDVYGRSRIAYATTDGKLKFSASLTITTSEFDALCERLGDGFMDVPFLLSISASVLDRGVEKIRTDELWPCRIKKIDQKNKEGSDAFMTDVELTVTNALFNGLSPILVDPATFALL